MEKFADIFAGAISQNEILDNADGKEFCLVWKAVYLNRAWNLTQTLNAWQTASVFIIDALSGTPVSRQSLA